MSKRVFTAISFVSAVFVLICGMAVVGGSYGPRSPLYDVGLYLAIPAGIGFGIAAIIAAGKIGARKGASVAALVVNILLSGLMILALLGF